MKKVQALLLVVMVLLAVTASAAMMGSNDGSGMMNGTGTTIGASGMMNVASGMMGGTTPMMTNTGSFGMMNGTAGTPMVGDDGTAYVMTYNATTSQGSTPGSSAFETHMLAVTPAGQTSSLTLNGIVSKPVVVGNLLAATASLPDLNNFTMLGNYGDTSSAKQSVLYVVALPFSASTKPAAISLDGAYASMPVIANNHIYITTTDFGGAMMGNGAFTTMYGNYNFNVDGTAKTYLYILNSDGTLASKTTIQ